MRGDSVQDNWPLCSLLWQVRFKTIFQPWSQENTGLQVRCRNSRDYGIICVCVTACRQWAILDGN